ncbi:KTSC domain-containing protein [Arenibacter sp. ARW7G5Y1]|uniref:KTSC domain-containing protein n=1 Tax=Arenibacter sp. ARW7G5Y1 TaxID=2135619 RepID=UPI000D763CFA|nr:KTSC domain-containing protein [Arenibacter sp. ARW7G5Y1]PXX22836.1 KTSC domain-containing protein [Arenibacter sp. ARW7G5Y1]
MINILKVICIILMVSCQPNDCEKLPNSFTSYQDGLSTVTNSTFAFIDQVDTSESSWIRGAQYYSCNNDFGFMVLSTDSKKYLHQGIPLSVWKEFKESPSFGSFYNRNIKGRYQLQLN